MLKMKLTVSGKVQGVGYRYSVLQHVEQLGLPLRGFVQNMPNGTVEIVAAGDLESLKKIRNFALKGSPSSVVRDVQEEFADIDEDLPEGFIIKG